MFGSCAKERPGKTADGSTTHMKISVCFNCYLSLSNGGSQNWRFVPGSVSIDPYSGVLPLSVYDYGLIVNDHVKWCWWKIGLYNRTHHTERLNLKHGKRLWMFWIQHLGSKSTMNVPSRYAMKCLFDVYYLKQTHVCSSEKWILQNPIIVKFSKIE